MSYTQQYFAQEKAIRAPGDEAGSSGLISSKRVEDRCRNGKVTCDGNYRSRGLRVESKVLIRSQIVRKIKYRSRNSFDDRDI